MRPTAPTSHALMAALFTLLAWAANPHTTQAQLPDYLPTEGLVGWWPFNGNANDESGNGNDGVVNGATLTEDRDGNPNAAYSFDGVDDWIHLNSLNEIAGVTQLTINAWVYAQSNPNGYARIFSQEGQDYFTQGISLQFASANNSIQGSIRNNANTVCQTQSVLALNQWSQVTLVFDGLSPSNNDRLKIYFNGEQQGVSFLGTIPSETFQGTVSAAIGRNSDTGQSLWDGQIDDIAIYNRALTPEEITALYTGIPYIAPCADPTACNFEQDGDCVFPEPNLDCDGNCLNDCNNNGVCDENEVLGCTYTFACNYNPAATTDDGTCTVAQPNYDCDGNCLNDDNQNGVCDDQEVYGCTYVDAINFDEAATSDDGSCLYTCKGDFDNNGLVDSNDLLSFLAAFGYSCSDAGCDDEAACNYDPEALYSDGSCTYPEEFFNCEGAPVNDADGDGIPDELEVPGCTDPEAMNYTPEATDDDGSCVFGIVGDAHTCGAENVHNPDLVYGSVTDIDGNTYRTIVIGEQEWMAENLNVSHYANGDPIPQVTENDEWVNLTTGAWCYYDNDPTYECPYGKLYNWYVTIDERNVCPTGWHVPSDAEWTLLTDYLGGQSVAGGKMKSTGTQYWQSPNAGATNESGFSGLPSGSRLFGFENLSVFFSLWSSTESNASNAWHRRVNSDSGDIASGNPNKESGLAIRCLKD